MDEGSGRDVRGKANGGSRVRGEREEKEGKMRMRRGGGKWNG